MDENKKCKKAHDTAKVAPAQVAQPPPAVLEGYPQQKDATEKDREEYGEIDLGEFGHINLSPTHQNAINRKFGHINRSPTQQNAINGKISPFEGGSNTRKFSPQKTSHRRTTLNQQYHQSSILKRQPRKYRKYRKYRTGSRRRKPQNAVQTTAMSATSQKRSWHALALRSRSRSSGAKTRATAARATCSRSAPRARQAQPKLPLLPFQQDLFATPHKYRKSLTAGRSRASPKLRTRPRERLCGRVSY